MNAIELIVTSAGCVRCVYNESIDLAKLGAMGVRRGSHVEPNKYGQWTADLSPVGGPVLGPFLRRSEALDAEVRWLQSHWLNS